MSKTLAESGGQKSTSISTAKRLAEFLGDQMVKDKGLACKFIISEKPAGAPVTERAVPVAIFSADQTVKRTYLRKWLKDNSLTTFDLRHILDWAYYIERLGSVIQKLITIPAAMQKVANPVPRIRHPDWLHRRVAGSVDKFKQNKMTDFFRRVTAEDQIAETGDIEDVGQTPRLDWHRTAVVNRKVDGRDNEAASAHENASETAGQPHKDAAFDADNNPRTLSWYECLRLLKPRWQKRQQAVWGGGSSVAIPAFFRGARIRKHHRWDIVQIQLSQIGGRFNLWLSVDSGLVSVPLRIPRVFYLRLRQPVKDDVFRADRYSCDKVVRHLPQNIPCNHLYKITVKEDAYQELQDHFVDLMNDPNVEGVFEQQAGLFFSVPGRYSILSPPGAIDCQSPVQIGKNVYI
jgi:DNA polymerase epsilon subunit 1